MSAWIVIPVCVLAMLGVWRFMCWLDDRDWTGAPRRKKEEA